MTAAALIVFGTLAAVVILGFIGAHQAIPTFGTTPPRHARTRTWQWPCWLLNLAWHWQATPYKVSRYRRARMKLASLRPLPRRDGDDGEHVAEWLHRLAPPEPARRPRQLTDAWLALAAIYRALPLDQLPYLRHGQGYSDSTGTFAKITEGEK